MSLKMMHEKSPEFGAFFVTYSAPSSKSMRATVTHLHKR